jgi:hypothetical protein
VSALATIPERPPLAVRSRQWFESKAEYPSRYKVVADGLIQAIWSSRMTAEQMANRLSGYGHRVEIIGPTK